MSWIALQVITTTNQMRINLLLKVITILIMKPRIHLTIYQTALSYIQSVATKQQKLFKILLDTGTSASLILETILTHKDQSKFQKDEQGPTLWKSRGRSFTTTTAINFVTNLLSSLPIVTLFTISRSKTLPNMEEYVIIIG